MFNVVEVFESIQGEGPFIGQPSLFIRAAGCNLHCKTCDTRYSWKKDSYWDKPSMCRMLDQWPGPVVLTGGEPLLQPDLVELITQYCSPFKPLTIETNGTIVPDRRIQLADWVSWSVSPKLPWFHPTYPGLQRFSTVGTRWYKFVVRNAQDIEAALKLVPPSMDEVIFQPLGYTRKQARSQYLEELAVLAEYITVHARYTPRPLRALPQLHVLLEVK